MGIRPASVVLAVLVAGCGAADNRVDPGDLALRDLLGIAPHVAVEWDDGQRAAARHVLGEALDGTAAAALADRPLAAGRTRSERIARTLAVADGDRAGAGVAPVPLVRVIVDGITVESAARPALTAATLANRDGSERADALTVELWLSPAWDGEPRWGALPGRGLEVLAALALDAGHGDGPVVVVPAPRLAVAAAYVAAGDGPAEILINPVVLAALEPDPLEAASAAGLTRPPLPGGGGAGAGGGIGAEGRAAGAGGGGGADLPGAVSVNGTGGNPYSFYGSVAECAYAQRTRCEQCLAAGDCVAVTDTTDGNAECTTLAADGGRGYFLLCVNLSLAIASVDACAADEVPACPRDSDAASKLAELANNANFLDDAACATGLDTCLADIYGAPPNPFPGLDGGTAPPDPPRDIDVSCGDSCDSDNNNGNVECSPSCSGGSGPSCNNAFSCDSTCSSSNEQSGCGGNCEACNASSDSGGSTSSGCGGCDSEGSSGSSGESCGSCDNSDSTGGGSGCGSSDGGSSGGSGCGDCGSSGGSTGGDSSCGDCGGSGGGGGDSGCGGGDCGGSGSGGGGGCGSSGGGGSSSCNVARRGPPASVTLLIALMWGLMPIPAALLVRRRARRRRGAEAETETRGHADPRDQLSRPHPIALSERRLGRESKGGHQRASEETAVRPSTRRYAARSGQSVGGSTQANPEIDAKAKAGTEADGKAEDDGGDDVDAAGAGNEVRS